jgi:hypothetical protein
MILFYLTELEIDWRGSDGQEIGPRERERHPTNPGRIRWSE